MFFILLYKVIINFTVRIFIYNFFNLKKSFNKNNLLIKILFRKTGDVRKNGYKVIHNLNHNNEVAWKVCGGV